MKAYIEITLLPDIDVPLNFLWQKVYQQLHLGFVEMKKEDGTQPIGVSLPKYDALAFTLGDKLRLFAHDSKMLEQFNAKFWLKKLSNYVHVTGVRDVPEKVKYGCFQRVQLKTNTLRLARRKAKRENIDLENALLSFHKFDERKTDVPFVVIKSVSTREMFRLFILYNEQDTQKQGDFSTYGLSDKTTVPIFQ